MSRLDIQKIVNLIEGVAKQEVWPHFGKLRYEDVIGRYKEAYFTQLINFIIRRDVTVITIV